MRVKPNINVGLTMNIKAFICEDNIVALSVSAVVGVLDQDDVIAVKLMEFRKHAVRVTTVVVNNDDFQFLRLQVLVLPY